MVQVAYPPIWPSEPKGAAAPPGPAPVDTFQAWRHTIDPIHSLDISLVTTYTAFNMDGANHGTALIVDPVKAGVVNRIGIYISAIAGNPPDYKCGLYTVDTTTGIPTNTPAGGSSEENVDLGAAASGWYWVTLSTPATVAPGTPVAIVFKSGTVNPDGSNYAVARSGIMATPSLPRSQQNSGAGYIAITATNLLAMSYNDGQVQGIPLSASIAGDYIASNTTPDEYGNKFTPPVDVLCDGYTVEATTVGNGAFTVKLYDSANNLLASKAWGDEDEAGGSGLIRGMWATPVRLYAGQVYRITFVPGNTTAAWCTHKLVCDASGSRSAFLEGANWQRTERTDAGAWTDTPTVIQGIGISCSGIYHLV